MILGELIDGALSSCKASSCQLLASSARSVQSESFLQPEAPSVCIDRGVFAIVVSDTTLACSSVRHVDEAPGPSSLVYFVFLTSSCLFISLFPQIYLNLVVFSVSLYVRQHIHSHAPSVIVSHFSSLCPLFPEARGQLGLGLGSFCFVGLTSLCILGS